MTLAAFQRALCDLVASPRLCVALREDPQTALADYDLSAREFDRLVDAVWQKGMSTNCSLYRSNRITPIYTLLNSTCMMLGEAFPALIDRFWESKEFRDGQYFTEVEKFAHFLKRLIAAGELDGSFLEEVLDFEVAAVALMFSPRRKILAALAEPPAPMAETRWRLHPLVRVVAFRHDPDIVIAALRAERPPDPELPAASFFVALSVVGPALEVVPLPPQAGRTLAGSGSGEGVPLPPETALALRRAGVLVPAGAH